MFQVIYTWSVPIENKSAFLDCWKQSTNHIHNTVEGALGSYCVQSADNAETILTIAKWLTREQWEAFISTAQTGAMRDMHLLAERVSVNGYYQLGDQTKPAVASTEQP